MSLDSFVTYVLDSYTTSLPTGRRDSIGLPWPIDPTSEAVFGELTGDGPFPVKFAEAFGFGRENPTGTSDLVLSSPDGESGRPVGKGEGRGDPKGKLAVGAFSFGLRIQL